jgi:hypothetical protein
MVRAIFVTKREGAAHAMERFERDHPGHPFVEELLASIRASERGRQGRAQEPVRSRA